MCQKLRVYVSKYALTKGVLALDAEISDAGMITARPNGSAYPMHFHGEGKEWHRTVEGAMNRAEEMRAARLGSLTKQQHHLRHMKIKVKE